MFKYVLVRLQVKRLTLFSYQLTYRRKILVYVYTLNWHDTVLNSSSKLLKYIEINRKLFWCCTEVSSRLFKDYSLRIKHLLLPDISSSKRGRGKRGSRSSLKYSLRTPATELMSLGSMSINGSSAVISHCVVNKIIREGNLSYEKLVLNPLVVNNYTLKYIQIQHFGLYF